MKNKKAQTWSIDLIMGVVLFLLLIVIIYALLRAEVPRETQLRTSADQVYGKLDNNPTSGVPQIVRGNSLSEDQLKILYAMDYEELKAKLGITGEVCILIVDDFGGIVEITGVSRSSYSIGEGTELEIADGIYCGQ